jgi:hypothetical protein
MSSSWSQTLLTTASDKTALKAYKDMRYAKMSFERNIEIKIKN